MSRTSQALHKLPITRRARCVCAISETRNVTIHHAADGDGRIQLSDSPRDDPFRDHLLDGLPAVSTWSDIQLNLPNYG